MIRGIPAAQYPQERDRVLPFLEGFAKRSLGMWRVADLERDILGRDRQVWCINNYQALCLTHLSPEAVHLDACAGVRRHEWQDAMDAEMTAWAKALGKKRIIALVRPGWAKFGAARGYRETHREMTLEI